MAAPSTFVWAFAEDEDDELETMALEHQEHQEHQERQEMEALQSQEMEALQSQEMDMYDAEPFVEPLTMAQQETREFESMQLMASRNLFQSGRRDAIFKALWLGTIAKLEYVSPPPPPPRLRVCQTAPCCPPRPRPLPCPTNAHTHANSSCRTLIEPLQSSLQNFVHPMFK
jgi:hypothetical protein